MTDIIKGFFFDLDGTLVDTHEANFLAYRSAVLEVTGQELGDALRVQIKAGESSKDFLPALLPGISQDDIDKINSRKKYTYPEYVHISRLNTYLSTFLQQMSQHYTVALVTTAKKDNAEAVLKTHGIEDFFDFKVYGHDVKEMKPSPEAYHVALERANLKSNEVIAFEDSQKGIDAATAAGIKTIHIRNFV